MSVANDIITVARGELGYQEGRSNGHWNNKEKYAAEVPTLGWVSAGGYPWCAVFVCWAFFKAGALDLIPGGPTAAVEHFRDFGKQAGQFSEYPAIGAIAIFGRDGGTHTGIVESFDADTVTTLEGNTNRNGSPEGDGVYRKVHQRRDPYVYGYVYPKFPEGIVTADPKPPVKRATKVTRAKAAVTKRVKRVVRRRNAEAIAAAAEAGVKGNPAGSKARKVFQQISDLIKPYDTRK